MTDSDILRMQLEEFAEGARKATASERAVVICVKEGRNAMIVSHRSMEGVDGTEIWDDLTNALLALIGERGRVKLYDGNKVILEKTATGITVKKVVYEGE